MTELVTYQTPSAPDIATPDRPMRLVEWASEARAAHALAESLCQTPFAGQFRGDPLGGTAAILKGAEVGLTPVTALGAFDLIQGVVAPKAITLRALVQAHGHTVWIESSTPTECVAKAKRRGESVTHESRWTMKRAQAMNLTNKPNWKNQPEAMLMARATSEVCRMVAADVILGIGYSAEEVEDNQPAPTVTITRTEAPPTKARRKPVAAPEPEEPPLKPESTPAAEARSEAQMRKLWATAKDVGMDEAGFRAWITDCLGREVESTKTLTRDEAARLIDALEQTQQGNNTEDIVEAEVVA